MTRRSQSVTTGLSDDICLTLANVEVRVSLEFGSRRKVGTEERKKSCIAIDEMVGSQVTRKVMMSRVKQHGAGSLAPDP